MAVFGCAYAYLVCWTPQGAALFYYEHQPHFWQEARAPRLVPAGVRSLRQACHRARLVLGLLQGVKNARMCRALSHSAVLLSTCKHDSCTTG
jgi:hypothetical protein